MGSTNEWGMGTAICHLREARMRSSSAANSWDEVLPWWSRESSDRGGSLRSKNLAAISRQVVATVRSARMLPIELGDAFSKLAV